MRQVLLVFAMLLFAGMAFGQASVVGGWATNLGWAGYYPAPPFIPVVTTPGITLQAFSPSPVGASNATLGLTAGATNSTLSMVTPDNINSYTVPVWSGSESTPLAVAPSVAPSEPARPHARRYFEAGVAQVAMRPGVSEAAKVAKATRRPARRTYTNQDIDRIRQQPGTIKYDGKTEHIG